MNTNHALLIVAVAASALATSMFTAFSSPAFPGDTQHKKAEAEPGEWSVSLNRSGGNLSAGDSKITIAVKAGTSKGTRTRALSGGGLESKEVSIPSSVTTRLWKTLDEAKAWELGDFSKPALDAPDYTIRLQRAGKHHTIRVQGAGESEAHLKLILAIQQCFAKGAAK
jgi:hypothetical protein